MQPNEQTVVAMREASQANAAAQDQSQRGKTNFAPVNQGAYPAGGAAAQPGQPNQPGRPGQPNQPGQVNQNVNPPGLGQGQTAAAGGLISGAMSRRI